jgi:hypothetical protein
MADWRTVCVKRKTPGCDWGLPRSVSPSAAARAPQRMVAMRRKDRYFVGKRTFGQSAARGGRGVDQSDHRQDLLWLSCERPCCCAAESDNEVAPSKANAHLALPCEPVDQAGDRASTGDRGPTDLLS